MNQKKNIILADCVAAEVETFREGLEESTGLKFSIESFINNKGHGSKLKQLGRYARYFTVPFKVFLHRKEYGVIVGWQQFYANLFAFYCRLFCTKKVNLLVSCNFTYKSKGGVIGKVYYRFMKYALANRYVDYLHVPSHKYAERCCYELNIPLSKFIVTTFGIPDEWNIWKSSEAPCKSYVLSIGRSNRDFDFLLKVWASDLLKKIKLVIISDTYKPSLPVPHNAVIYDNITGAASKPWIAHCEMMMLPIDDGNIASGDTVLLSGMQMEKVVVITKPSTLAEMYIHNGIDGFAAEKDVDSFAELVCSLMKDENLRCKIGRQARQSYLEHFSRHSLGVQIGKGMKLVL